MDELAQALSSGSADALAIAQRAGEAGRAAAIGALQNQSPIVRHLAVAALRTINDVRDVPVYIALLADAALSVRLQSAQAILENHLALPVLGAKLTDALKEAKDPEVRVMLARALGERPDTSVGELANLETQQTDPAVRAQVIAALAKLGSPPHIAAFRTALLAARGDERARWLGLAEYVGASWLLRDLAKLLDDEEKLEYAGHCADPGTQAEGPEPWVRTCDYAARVISVITRETPAFAEERGWLGLRPEDRGAMREIALRHAPPEPGAAGGGDTGPRGALS